MFFIKLTPQEDSPDLKHITEIKKKNLDAQKPKLIH